MKILFINLLKIKSLFINLNKIDVVKSLKLLFKGERYFLVFNKKVEIYSVEYKWEEDLDNDEEPYSALVSVGIDYHPEDHISNRIDHDILYYFDSLSDLENNLGDEFHVFEFAHNGTITV